MIFQKCQFLKLYIHIMYYRYTNKKIKLIVGGAGTKFQGWITSDIRTLDVTSYSNWQKLFKRNEISHILAEHVWEHLSIEDSQKALHNCHIFLKKRGKIRIAVPDGYFPDQTYINSVKPGGFGPGSDDHKILYTYLTLSRELINAGFDFHLIEYFNENGQFVRNEWSIDDGFIHRSYQHDIRNIDGLRYTSLIIDGVKR